MRHNYWTIRYVPDPVRGERVNIGVIVGSDDERDGAMRIVDSPARANRLGGGAQRALAYVNALQRRVESALLPEDGLPRDSAPITSALLDRLHSHQENAVQVSSARTIAGADVNRARQGRYHLLRQLPGARASGFTQGSGGLCRADESAESWCRRRRSSGRSSRRTGQSGAQSRPERSRDRAAALRPSVSGRRPGLFPDPTCFA